MGVSVDEIKEVREMTSCGVIECKKALEEAKGDVNKAKEVGMIAEECGKINIEYLDHGLYDIAFNHLNSFLGQKVHVIPETLRGQCVRRDMHQTRQAGVGVPLGHFRFARGCQGAIDCRQDHIMSGGGSAEAAA